MHLMCVHCTVTDHCKFSNIFFLYFSIDFPLSVSLLPSCLSFIYLFNSPFLSRKSIKFLRIYRVITNYMSDYVALLVRKSKPYKN